MRDRRAKVMVWRGWFLGLLLMVAGCAPVPKVMNFEMPQAAGENRLVWPSAPAPARIAYVGDLIGENNFTAVTDGVKSGFRDFIEMLAGVGLDQPEPRVMRRPQSGVTGPDGRIYVTDVGASAVFVFDPDAGTLEIWNSLNRELSFVAPTGVALDDMGRLLVADSELGEILVLDAQTGELRGRFGGGVLQRPTGLALAADRNRVLVADTRAHDIKVFDLEGQFKRRIGGPGTEPGTFNAPVYLHYQDDRIYVSDVLNARVQALTFAGEPLASIGERGLYVGNLTRPKGIGLDRDGNLYVVESYYDHLLVYNQQGQLLLPIGGPGHAAGRFFLPAGLWVDDQDRIYVADMLNGRVSIFQYLGNP